MTLTETHTQTRNITLTQALNEAMREEMRRDDTVFIMGEDIQSGVYGASGGLFAEFGGERVRDCPLSENAFMGAAVGAAAPASAAPIAETAISSGENGRPGCFFAGGAAPPVTAQDTITLRVMWSSPVLFTCKSSPASRSVELSESFTHSVLRASGPACNPLKNNES